MPDQNNQPPPRQPHPTKTVFENISTTRPRIDSKLFEHQVQYPLLPQLNLQTQHFSFAKVIAIEVVVVVPPHPCHTPVRGKTTPKFGIATSPFNKFNHQTTKTTPPDLENLSWIIQGLQNLIPNSQPILWWGCRYTTI